MQANATSPVENFLKDYQAPSFSVDSIYLQFELQPEATTVTNTMQISPQAGQGLEGSEIELFLNGESLELISVVLNGEGVLEKCVVDAEGLRLQVPIEPFKLQITTQINPQGNTALQGLYRTSGNYCTQCEAEGFRNITYYFDRPDVLTTFTTKIIADKTDNKVLLSNGNLIESGDLPAGKHYAVWQDPFKKPCYLFALVAGNLEKIADKFIAGDGREIDLEIFVEPRNIDKCDHAMESLKKSMKWDEDRFGLIYDLDIYMIVAVDDFNMGAMENKGLNVFNSKFVLAKPESATDVDYEGIESVIAHEYFHNWTGNRVTCRDWFQLTLKEGLTVFRDQEFTADMLSPEVKRIEDVKRLRSFQFPEDAGPMQHPIQPQSYIEMNNFYTMTVYEKGAEVVRLYHTILGEEGFQKGMKLYFERHDGQAVRVEDFRNAMADANGVDLSQMHNWYVQAGTPTLEVRDEYDAQTQTYTLHCKQTLHNLELLGKEHAPLLIPLKIGFISAQGEQTLAGESLAFASNDQAVRPTGNKNEVVISLTELEQSFEFTGVSEKPIPSLLRGFSAPVILDYDYSDENLAALASFDSDSFVLWESMQTLALRNIKQVVAAIQSGKTPSLNPVYAKAFEVLLETKETSESLIAMTLTQPDLTYIGEQFEQIDVDAVLEAHKFVHTALAQNFTGRLKEIYDQLNSELNAIGCYRYHKSDMAKRSLQNVCLRYLAYLPDQAELAAKQYDCQANMNQVLASLQALSLQENAFLDERLQDFYQRWSGDPLVLDKWFSLQASIHDSKALSRAQGLLEHSDFSFKNPNRVRSLLGVFARNNWMGFHQADGAGYAFMAEQIKKLDELNPQIASRLMGPFTQWKRYAGERQNLMKQAVESILAKEGLSKDVFEIASKTIKS